MDKHILFQDEQGRFGFNVKGGVDQKLPIIVSRVGANTPADKWVTHTTSKTLRVLMDLFLEVFRN